MKLIEFVEKYKGTAKFDVNNIPTINIVVKPEEKQPDVLGGETQSPDGSGTGETTGDE